MEAKHGGTGLYLDALRRCREKLDAADEELLERSLCRGSWQPPNRRPTAPTPTGVCNSLTRIQRWLFECIRIELARQEPFRERNAH